MGNKSVSGYDGYTTGMQVLGDAKLTDMVIIVTGGNSGIGKETCRVLAKAGAHVIIAARDEKKSEQVKQEIISEFPISCLQLDLGYMQNIDEFAQKFIDMKLPLHILINNAGSSLTRNDQKTKDGFEFQVRVFN